MNDDAIFLVAFFCTAAAARTGLCAPIDRMIGPAEPAIDVHAADPAGSKPLAVNPR